jgi:oligoendopeptidase F
MATKTKAVGQEPLAKAQGVRWDLRALYANPELAKTEMVQVVADAKKLQKRYQGRVAALDGARLATLIGELGQLVNRSRAASAYCGLLWYADSNSPESQDLRGAADRAAVEFANLTRFFELEWQALGHGEAAALTASPALAKDRHFLERLTDQAEHTLSAPEERVLAERSTAADSAWQQLFDQTTAAITVEFSPRKGNPTLHTIDELLAYLLSDRSKLRARALEALCQSLEPWAPVLAKTYDSLVGDRLVMDRLRHFTTTGRSPKPLFMQQANLANDLADEVVNRLIDAVGNHYPVAQRYFRIKADRMGLKKLRLSDQYAPVGKAKSCTFDEARLLVLEAVSRFSPQAERILGAFFSGHRIDAEPRPGKQGGAFCESVSQDKPSYVLLNFTDTAADAEVMAHELGHGLHFTLAQGHQSPFSYETGMAMGEMAAFFLELVLFNYLLEREEDPEIRGALISAKVERCFNSIFRQTMMARYEKRSYAAKSQGESLTPDRLAGFWIAEVREYYGDTVEIPAGYRVGWSAIHHFIVTRFYTYSYSFAYLAALALYVRFGEDQQAFVPKYLKLLAAGSSRSPAELLGDVGINISDDHWVDPAFAVLDSWVDAAQESWAGSRG